MTPQVLDTSAMWWAWAATALVSAAIVYDVRRDIRRLISARNVVLFGILVWYLFEALQARPAVFTHGAETYKLGILLVVLAAASFLVGYHRSQARWFDGLGPRVARLNDWGFLRQTLIIGIVVGSIPVALYGLADPMEMLRSLVASRQTWRGPLVRSALGDFRSTVVMLETFLMGVAWVAMLALGHRRRTRSAVLIAVAVVAWHLLRSYGTGTRSLVFLSFLIPTAWCFWRAGARTKRLILVAAIPCAVLFYWFSAAMVEGRGQGRLEFDKTPEYVGHEMFRELLYVIEEVPNNHPHMYGETYFIELINPIPRVLWANKPVGFGVTYAKWQGYDALKGGPTFSPGILGEMYINFGALGIVFLSILGGVVCRAWDRLGPQRTASLPVLLFYSLGLGCFLMMGRSFSIQLFYQLFASLICMELAARRLRATRGVESCLSSP